MLNNSGWQPTVGFQRTTLNNLESLENQRIHYQEYISNHSDWQLAKVYYDEGISGTKLTKRNALKELLADCHNHRIDFVITKSISRLSTEHNRLFTNRSRTAAVEHSNYL
jgi:DNA invertase Pin-like site-specific DNA recombinase